MKIGFNLGDTAYTHLYAPSEPERNDNTRLSANPHPSGQAPHSPKGTRSGGLMIVEGVVVDFVRLQYSQAPHYQVGVVLRMKNSPTEIPFPLTAVSATVEGAKAIVARNLQPIDA